MNLVGDQQRAIPRNVTAPCGPVQERRVSPRYDSTTRARLVWKDGESDLEPCSQARLETAVLGRRPRRGRRHDPSTALEALEGRQLLAATPVATVSTMAAQIAPLNAARPTPTLYGIANDAFLSNVLYSHPSRMASQIAPDGAVGVNATWESGQASSWYIEQQRYGADYIQAGLVTDNPALVRQGWQILDWGFAREAADGAFPGTGDAFHSTSMFVEAAARALLLEVQSGAADAPELVARHLPKIDASARWLMNPTVSTKGNLYDAPYTHRRWLLAAALGQVAALNHDPAMAAAAATYARQGLVLQTADGMNPEKGGGDASYQTYGILLAECYLVVCPDPVLWTQVQEMIVRSLSWEMTHIDPSGQVSIADSTRTGQEKSRAGTMSKLDYKTIVQAFSVATALTGDPSYVGVAQSIAAGRGWVSLP